MRGESNNKKNSNKKDDSNSAANGLNMGSPVISNTKARGVIILIAALLIFQIGTFIFKTINDSENFDKINKEEQVSDCTDLTEKKYVKESTADWKTGKTAVKTVYRTNKLFKFNPNIITLDSLVLLGFSPKQAQSILNYIDKGGRFSKKEDFSKMYVVSEKKYAALKDWIYIPVKDSGNYSVSMQLNDSIYNRVLPDSTLAKPQWICNLNTADSAQLIKLYGIGPYFSRKILTYRKRLGGSFANKEQLLEIDGIDKERYIKFEKKIFIDTSQIKKYYIEELERKFMEQHPYIGAYAARGIILYRDKKTVENNKITLMELVNENILSADAAFRLHPYIK